MGVIVHTLRTWGYVSVGLGIGLALLTIALAILTLVSLKGGGTVTFKQNTENFAIAMIAVGVIWLLIFGIAVAKLRKAYEEYNIVIAGLKKRSPDLTISRAQPPPPPPSPIVPTGPVAPPIPTPILSPRPKRKKKTKTRTRGPEFPEFDF